MSNDLALWYEHYNDVENKNKEAVAWSATWSSDKY